MARKLKNDEFYWGKTPKSQSDGALIARAIKNAVILAHSESFLREQASYLATHLIKQKVAIEEIVDNALVYSLDRYDSLGSTDLARCAVEMITIDDEETRKEVIGQVCYSLRTYGTRRDYAQSVSSELKRICSSRGSN